MANINYKMFKNRKKFNILNWIRSDKEKTYESFVLFLKSKNVTPPDSLFFEKAFSLYESTKKREEDFKAKKNETIPINVEVSIPDVKEEVVVPEPEVKPKTRRRRRRKKTTNES